MVFDELLAKGDQRWGVCAVGMRSAQLSTQLRAQDYLYLVRISDAQGSRWHAPSSIVKTLVAASERDAVIEQIASPHTRWITLTVTEKAYTPALAGLIVDGLAARQAKGLAGLTIASCDNLPDNGRVLGALCQAQAASPPFDPSLQAWIETECRFPSSMVDRIVPAPSAEVRAAALQDLGLDDPSALGVEGFWEWVIEDALVEPADADALRSVGVVVTDDVAGFEQAKLWMLNASHTVLASIGAVLGDRFIRQVIARPVVRQWVHAYMTHASGPLVGRPNWQDYRDALIERFGNPMLDHACLQVYSDSSLKIPVRWVPVGQRLLDKVAGDRANTNALDASRLGLDCLAVAVAIFVRSLDPVTEAGEPFVFNDPLASELQALARDQRADPRATIVRLLAPADQGLALLGERLGADSVFLASAAHWLGRIHARGIESALQEFVQ
jgi:fructuronate reductase